MTKQYDPEKHHRRSIRLQGYDYSRPGSYFITICTHQRACLFGKVVDGAMMLNPLGEMVHQCWHDIQTHYPHVVLDEFIAMPNHVHGIITITDDGRSGVGNESGCVEYGGFGWGNEFGYGECGGSP